jgi:hypothetical protein
MRLCIAILLCKFVLGRLKRLRHSNECAVNERDAEKVLKRFVVADTVFSASSGLTAACLLGSLIGEIVLRFADDDFEHEEDIEVRSSVVGVFFSQHGKKRTKALLIKHSPIGIGGEAFVKTIELVEFIAIRFGGNQIRLHRIIVKKRR